MGLGGFLKKVGNNTLHDAEGIVDPRNYVRAGKMAVQHPVGFGESILRSYADLVRHPIRSAEHPLTTTLALLPVAGGAGKLADIGAEAGAARYTSMLDKAELRSGANYVRNANKGSIVPGVRAARLAKAVGRNEKTIFQDLKYRPGTGGAITDQPGLFTDRGLLAQLHSELGKPNTNYFTDFATPQEQAGQVGGAFLHGRQEASALAHPAQMLAEGPSDVLTKTLLHEARHGYQKANMSRGSRYVDIHRPYNAQKMELDANAFSDSALPRYKGLVSVDPKNPRIPQFAQPTMAQRLAVAKASTHPALAGVENFKDVQQLIDQMHGGFTGVPSEDEILNHMDALVKEGKLSRDEAIDLQMQMADNPYETASYKKPTSQNDLLRRSIKKARANR